MVDRQRVIIREAKISDLEPMTNLYNYYVENTAITFDTTPFAPEARKLWFDQFSPQGPHRLFIAESDGQLAGYASSTKHRAKPAYDISVEMTIYLDQRFAGLGLGRKLYEALFLALSREDIRSAYAGVALPNDRSIAFHEALGFAKIGTFHEVGRKFGRYYDVMWFEKRI